ncbi:uncharacterized protein LOC143056860 [Mytilus galloprovincialis]|uniref:uncharacterized protein LOC143056860 n=1 Tax=Mytilus galloprovincialis TaxID=29158 RepID=UPI003F7C0F89
MEMYEAKIKTWEDSIPTHLDKIDSAKKKTETFLESMREILHQEQTRLNGSFHETVENVYLKSENKVKSALDLLSYKIEEYNESQNRRENAIEPLRSSLRQEKKQFEQEQTRINNATQETVENTYRLLESKVKSVTDSLSIKMEEFENKSENVIDLLQSSFQKVRKQFQQMKIRQNDSLQETVENVIHQSENKVKSVLDSLSTKIEEYEKRSENVIGMIQSSFQKEREQFKQIQIRLNDSFQDAVENIYLQSETKVKSVLDSLSTKIGDYEKRSENALKLLHSTLLQEQQRYNDTFQVTVDNIETQTESKVKSMLESISFKMNEFSKSLSKREDALELLQHNFRQEKDRFNQSLYFMENNIKEDLNTTIQNFISRIPSHDSYYIDKGKECKDIADVKSGIYTISPDTLHTFKVRCEDENWTVIQKRFDGSTEFYRNWEDYEHGFGDLNGEFWLGNRNIELLTSIGTHELRINLEDWDGSKRYANFKNFKIDGASNKYKLHISGYSGDAGDGMTEYNGSYFSTYDRLYLGNCAAHINIKGAWWFYDCLTSHGASLNGKYTSGPSYYAGIRYRKWKYKSLKKSTMMIRRV